MSHSHNHSPQNNSISNIKLAFFLNLSFTIIELIGGYMTNSVAIMSDALHDLGDSISLLLAWFLEKFSTKAKSKQFSYGYKRFSLLGALVNSVILFVGSLFILSKAIPRLINPESSNAQGMLLLSILGVAVNGFAAYKTTKGKTMNERVVSLHLMEDVLGWIAVLIVSIVMIFTKIQILDPILSIVITAYIFWGVLKNIKETALLFLQATPNNLNPGIIEKEIVKNKLVLGVHDTHVWSLDGEKHVLSTHVIIGKDSSNKEMGQIKCDLKEKMHNIGIEHSTLEVEFEDEGCEGYSERE